MLSWILPLLAGGTLLTLFLALYGPLRTRLRAPLWVVTGLGGFALGLGVAYGLPLFWGTDPGTSAANSPPPAAAPFAAGAAEGRTQPPPVGARPPGADVLTLPLEPGAVFPELSAGWLNGPPPPRTGKVVVVDVWADS